jgi:hypothetical protein
MGGDILKVKYSTIAIFAGGLILGALTEYGVPKLFPTETEKNWRQEHSEDSSHARILKFQQALNNQGAPKDTESLQKQIDVQLKIEELVVQSREAQYAGLTPFTSISSTVGALLVAILSFAAGFWGKKRGDTSAPNP